VSSLHRLLRRFGQNWALLRLAKTQFSRLLYWNRLVRVYRRLVPRLTACALGARQVRVFGCDIYWCHDWRRARSAHDRWISFGAMSTGATPSGVHTRCTTVGCLLVPRQAMVSAVLAFFALKDCKSSKTVDPWQGIVILMPGYILYSPVVKVSRILLDLRSGAQKFLYRETRDPVDISNAPGDIGRISQGPWN